MQLLLKEDKENPKKPRIKLKDLLKVICPFAADHYNKGLKRYCSSPIHKRFDILDGGDYQKDVKSNREVHTTLTSGQNLLKARNIPTGKRSEEHTSELQSLMIISYAIFCLKK